MYRLLLQGPSRVMKCSTSSPAARQISLFSYIVYLSLASSHRQREADQCSSMEAESSTAGYNASQVVDRKGKGRALPSQLETASDGHSEAVSRLNEDGSWKAAWRRSRRRAQADKTSWDYSASQLSLSACNSHRRACTSASSGNHCAVIVKCPRADE
jgi:hypothetical protein